MATQHFRLISFLKNRIFLFILLGCFILLKIPHLNFPFYWDECWPYASAIRRMYEAGPTLLPGTLDPEYSRGHPLLFHFLASAWMKIFGVGHVAMHSFALTVSVMGIITVYEAGLRLFNIRVGALAAMLVSFQVIFFVQATFMLPEVLLAVLAFASFCLYASRHYLAAGIVITLLLFTKESGVIAGLIMGLDALWQCRNSDRTSREKWAGILATGLPFVLLLLFFLLQHKAEGWFLFPVHEKLIERNVPAMLEKLRNCFDILFTHDLRLYYLLLLIALVVVATVSRKRGNRGSAPGQGIPAFSAESRKTLRLMLIFIPAFFLFSAVNMLIARYLIITLLPAMFLLAVCFDLYARRIHPFTYYLVVAVVVFILSFSFYKDKGINDRNLGAFDAMRVQEKVVGFLEDHQAYRQHISSNAYLERIHLTDAYAGYLRSDRSLEFVQPTIDEQTALVIFTNVEPDDTYSGFHKQHPQFRLWYRVERGEVWAEIYTRK